MVWIYDIEIFPNAFCVGFENYKSNERHMFEISPWRNESNNLREFLLSVKWLVGYNNSGYENLRGGSQN